MIVDKFFPKSSIEPFHVGIHFWGLGIGVPMVFVQPANFLIKVLHELRAIVGQDGVHIVREVDEEPFQEGRRGVGVAPLWIST